VDEIMIKQSILVLSALTLTACVGSGTETANFDKPSTLQAACPGLTAVSAQYSVAIPGLPVRCGPQSEVPVTFQ
jgi:hypothetical protein